MSFIEKNISTAGSDSPLSVAKKQSRKTKVVALSMGQGLTALVGLASFVILSRFLSKSEYATFRQTFLAYQFISPLLVLGLPQAIYYFLPGEKERIRGRVVDNLVLLIALGFVFSLFLGCGGNRLLAWRFSNPDLERTLLYLIPYPIFMLPMGLLAAVLVVREQVTLLSIFNVISRLLIGLAIITPLFFWRTATVSIMGQVGMTVVMAIVAIYLMLRATPRDSWKPKVDSMKQMLKYSVPLGLATMVGTISMQLDKIIVSSMCSPEEFAVYANGAIEIPLIGIITGSITVVVLADMRKSIIKGDHAEVIRLFRVTAEKSSCILFPMMLFLLVSGDVFIQTLFSEKYAESVIPFRIYLLVLPSRTVVFGSMLMVLGKNRLILYRTITGLCINVVTSIVLIWLSGPWGAAGATVFTILFWGVPYNTIVICRTLKIKWQALFPFQWFLKTLVFLILPTVLLIGAHSLTRQLHPASQLIIHGVIFWSLVGIWWNGKIYSLASLKAKFGFA